MPEFDLDNLKKQWQDQPLEQKYGAPEILQMLNKKSRNYVKYIFYISVIEFAFFIAVTLYYYIKGDDLAELMAIIERLGVKDSQRYQENFNLIYTLVKGVSLAVSCFFVIRFYRVYTKIKVEENLKSFILQIVKFRKTVSLFILLNIVLVVLFISLILAFVFAVLYQQDVHIESATLYGFATGLLVSTLFTALLIWIYYRLVYGILMGRLGRTLKQLKEIENSAVN